MAIFNSYVKLPEGSFDTMIAMIKIYKDDQFLFNIIFVKPDGQNA